MKLLHSLPFQPSPIFREYRPLWWLLILLLLPLTSFQSKEPLRILAVGDSITQGGKRQVQEYTYRYPLQQMLYQAGIDFEFLGSRQQGLHADATWPKVAEGLPFDPDHEGYYGKRTRFVCDSVMANYPKFGADPDVVLVHLGTNDQKHGDYLQNVGQPLRELIAFLRKQNPKVAVLLGHLNFNDSEAADQIRSVVERVAKELHTETAPVVTVHHYLGWNENPKSRYADTFDWAHPNLKGQEKMALRWWEAMQEIPMLRRPQKLFNGKDLAGWHIDVPALDQKQDSLKSPFLVRDGMLISMGEPRGHLITDRKFKDYTLELDYRFEANPGNCGVLVHASTPRALYKMFPKSIEVQMMHENAGDFWCIVEDIAVPDMLARRGPKAEWGITEGKKRRILNLTDGTEKPPGEWNHMKIRCSDDSITVWLNGVMVNQGYDCTATEGQIALQAEGAQVAFKNLTLTPLPSRP